MDVSSHSIDSIMHCNNCYLIEMRTECLALGSAMMTMDDWLTLWNDDGGKYTAFFERFVVHFVGAAKFWSKVSVQFLSKFVTIGDEAFALLVLRLSIVNGIVFW
jgi:hypothetical protein